MGRENHKLHWVMMAHYHTNTGLLLTYQWWLVENFEA
jgi:hypothetical protein